MTRAQVDNSVALAQEKSPTRSPLDGRVWGLDLFTAYRLFWGSRGVQVVRRGVAAGPNPIPVEHRGPNLYLLLGTETIIFADLSPLARKMSWLRASAMRLRITDSLSDGYTERIVADDNGDLVRIERSYGRRFRASARAWITADPKIAERWANLSQFTRGASWKWLHETVGRQNVGSAAVQGTVPETRSLEGRNAIMKTILEQWDRPAPIIENVYESHPAVWVHESASVEPEARLIGPLWIGAGVRIGAQTVVGPDIIADQKPCTQTDRIDWAELRRFNYLLQLPTVRRSRFGDATKRAFDIASLRGEIQISVELCHIGRYWTARDYIGFSDTAYRAIFRHLVELLAG